MINRKLVAACLISSILLASLTACSSETETPETEATITAAETTAETSAQTSETTIETTTTETTLEEPNHVPFVELNGNPNETFEASELCYTEDDRVIVFFMKDTCVPQNTLEMLNGFMDDIEETTNLTYDGNPEIERMYDMVTCDFLSDKDYEGLDMDSKIVIVVTPDNVHETSYTNACNIQDIDLRDEDFHTIIVHELCHVNIGVNYGHTTRVLDEGFAVYTTENVFVANGGHTWDYFQYVAPYEFDETYITDGEDGLIRLYKDEGDYYNYGIRFVTFLFDTYGDDVFADLYDVLKNTDYSDEIITYTDSSTLQNNKAEEIIPYLKEATSEDVFEQFVEWNSSKWPQICSEYNRSMGL